MDQRIVDACRRQASRYNVPAAHVIAFVEVESNGKAFDNAAGQTRTLIRYEGHYLYRRIKGNPEALAAALNAGLAARKWGVIKNPRSQSGRYDMLERAMTLCVEHGLPRDLAFECVSIGLGQVMGAHWADLGYPSAEAMLDEAHDETVEQDIEDQIEMMMRFLKANHLIDDLQRGDWVALARAYNGSGYAANSYDTKLAAAAAKWAGGPPATEYPTLRVGDHGRMVAALQDQLAALNYPAGKKNGEFGSLTRASVLAFQADNNLVTDGIAGPATWRALERAKPRPVSVERAGAKVSDLRKDGSSTIAATDKGAAAAVVLGGVGSIGAADDALYKAETGVALAGRAKSLMEPFWATIADYLPFILIGGGLLLGVGMFFMARRRLTDHRSGKNLGR